MKNKIFLILAFVFALSVRVKAQTPEKVNYQAIARDLSGIPLVSQTISVVIEIRQGSASGTDVYKESHAATTNAFGLFILEIGGGTPLAPHSTASFSAINWGTSSYYLHIEVDGNPIGASQLLSVPYALYSKESANGPTGAQGPPGIGINWLGTFTAAPATPNLNDAYYNSNTGQSFIWDGSTWQILAQDGVAGSLVGGPGITIVGSTINNTGDLDSTNELQTLTYNSATQDLGISNGNNVTLVVDDADNDPNNEIELPLTGNNNDVLTWNGSAWVGLAPSLGTDNQNLINGGKVGNNQTVNIQNGSGFTFSVADGDSSAFNEYNTSFNINGPNLELVDGGNTFQVALDSLADNDWTVSGTNTYSLNSIGIGTPTPGSELEINSANPTVRLFSSQTNSLASAYLRFGDNSGPGFTERGWLGMPGSGDYLEMGSPNSIFFNTNFAYRMVIANNGNVGVGITGPTSKFHVAGGHITMEDGNEQIGYIPVSNANGMMTWTDPSTITTSNDGDWTISGSNIYSAPLGNVGIGTTTPASKLEVAGGNMILRDQTDVTDAVELTSTSGPSAHGAIGLRNTGVNSVYLTGSGSSWFNAGNVGIGTNAPATQLEVQTTTNVRAAQFIQNFASNSNKYGLYSLAQGGGTGQNIGVQGEAANATVNKGVVGRAFGGTTNWAGYFETGNVYIADYLAIGITTPNFPLHVRTTSNVRGAYIETNGANSGGSKIGVTGISTNGAGTGINKGGAFNAIGGSGGDNYGVDAQAVNGVANQRGLNAIASGGSGTNYGIYSSALGGTTNWSGYFASGDVYVADFVGIGTTTPLSNLTVRQTATSADGTNGVRVEFGTASWNMYHSGAHLSFANVGVRQAYITGVTGVYVVTSDMNKKKNISLLGNVMPNLMQLKPSRYQYKSSGDDSPYTYGIMVQDVQKVFPELVHVAENGDLGLGYDEFVPIAIKAIQEQQKMIEELKLEVEKLKKQ